ncbi:hypothetical protein [Psychrobacter sp. ASPA161_6]|uniref:hypothetical protein n=1 Tax=Psychrobacter sp. ASPA161_6 TaxID=3160962 RepID=UPI003F7F6667
MKYFASKGLFIREVSNNTYVIEDVLGNSSSHFTSSEEDLDSTTSSLANIKRLIKASTFTDFESPDFSDFGWNKLERYYITQIDNSLLDSLLNSEEKNRYHRISVTFPIGYIDTSYTDASKETLEFMHNNFLKQCNTENSIVVEEDLNIFLVINQVSRICNDIMSLMQRSITYYVGLLDSQRNCIIKSHKLIHQFGEIDEFSTAEIIYRGSDSYSIASAVTSLVISLCSSLDLSAKLIHFINNINSSKIEYKKVWDKQYHEVKKLKPNFISGQVLDNIVQLQNTSNQIPELTQFRNDLIHSSSAIELERIYVGFETEEIKKLPLYYSAQYARDTVDSGQPVRFLGRNYFTKEKVDIEIKALEWIQSVLDYHVKVGDHTNSYLKSLKKHSV